MKISHLIKISLLLVITVFMFTSCYEENIWLEDNIVATGEHYPLIYMNTLDRDEYQAGENIEVLLEFSSLGELKEIVFYEKIGDAERKEVSRTPYQPAFSQIKSQDTLALNYTVPTVTDTISISLEAEAVNANGLTKSSSQNFTALP